jgi:long-chain acyl-CoA synthetase
MQELTRSNLIPRWAAGNSDVTMIISGERRIGYPELQAHIRRAATGFQTLGLRDGTPVAMMLRNDFALFEVAGGAAALA